MHIVHHERLLRNAQDCILFRPAFVFASIVWSIGVWRKRVTFQSGSSTTAWVLEAPQTCDRLGNISIRFLLLVVFHGPERNAHLSHRDTSSRNAVMRGPFMQDSRLEYREVIHTYYLAVLGKPSLIWRSCYYLWWFDALFLKPRSPQSACVHTHLLCRVRNLGVSFIVASTRCDAWSLYVLFFLSRVRRMAFESAERLSIANDKDLS